MSLAPVFEALGISQAQVRRESGLSRSSLSRLVTHGVWPARGEATARKSLETCLRKHGATPAQLLALFTPTKKLAPACQNFLCLFGQKSHQHNAYTSHYSN